MQPDNPFEERRSGSPGWIGANLFRLARHLGGLGWTREEIRDSLALNHGDDMNAANRGRAAAQGALWGERIAGWVAEGAQGLFPRSWMMENRNCIDSYRYGMAIKGRNSRTGAGEWRMVFINSPKQMTMAELRNAAWFAYNSVPDPDRKSERIERYKGTRYTLTIAERCS